MCKKLTCLFATRLFATGMFSIGLALGLSTTLCHGQLLGLYEFDGGGDGTSWNDANNWEQILDPDGNPISGNPAAPPAQVTSAVISLAGVVIDSSMPGQTALDVAIGTGSGAGSLSMSGGDLTLRDIDVGADAAGANNGSLNLTGGTLTAGDDITLGAGSTGVMTMSDGAASTGDDFFINPGSSLAMSGGSIRVGDRLVMEGNASLTLDGGEISADDDFYIFGDSQVTVNGGLMQTVDKLRFDDDDTKSGKVTINGGIVRSNEFGLADVGLRGVIEINGNGIYQVETAVDPTDPFTQLSVQEARNLIAAGVHFVTSEAAPKKLVAFSVVVPEFFGASDVMFTQISLVPEPASSALVGVVSLGLMMRRRRK